MSGLPFVSVVVPVLNREKDIGVCLDSVVALDYPSFEVIVVDNGSTDNTRNIVSRYPVQMLLEEQGGEYAARNRGIKAASGEIVAFTDSDCVAERNWLRELVAHYGEGKVGGVGGRLIAYRASTLVDEFLGFGRLRDFDSAEAAVIKKRTNRFLSGALGSANISYRRRVLEQLGGFCEDFKVSCGDYELCWRVQEAGHEVIYEPKATVHHRLRRSVSRMVMQFFRFGRCQPLLLRKQPGGFSYITIKTYLFRTLEFKCRLPFRALVTFDLSSLFVLAAVLILVNRSFLYLAVPALLLLLSGGMLSAAGVVKKTRKFKWFVLFPVLHLLINWSLALGRVVGGVRHRVIAF